MVVEYSRCTDILCRCSFAFDISMIDIYVAVRPVVNL